ncbi:hypothetical protein HK104_000439 [Borealophlyctis nickersoniae]|nr:hypothetical protein HK104_000439 [Borealophlyctis nickersoniae]
MAGYAEQKSYTEKKYPPVCADCAMRAEKERYKSDRKARLALESQMRNLETREDSNSHGKGSVRIILCRVGLKILRWIGGTGVMFFCGFGAATLTLAMFQGYRNAAVFSDVPSCYERASFETSGSFRAPLWTSISAHNVRDAIIPPDLSKCVADFAVNASSQVPSHSCACTIVGALPRLLAATMVFCIGIGIIAEHNKARLKTVFIQKRSRHREAMRILVSPLTM